MCAKSLAADEKEWVELGAISAQLSMTSQVTPPNSHFSITNKRGSDGEMHPCGSHTRTERGKKRVIDG